MQNNKLLTEKYVELEFVVISSPSFKFIGTISLFSKILRCRNQCWSGTVLFIILLYYYFMIPGGFGYLIVFFFVFDTIWVCIPCKNSNTLANSP